MIRIERAQSLHLPGITSIYNDAVLNTTVTFDTSPKTLDEQQTWLAHHSDRLPVFVAVDAQTRVVGWASLSAWSDRCAYSATAETSIYVDATVRRRGIGTTLLRKLVEHARETRLHTLLARVVDGNESSFVLHERAGFKKVGTMREVGNKFGRRLDVHLLQLMLAELTS